MNSYTMINLSKEIISDEFVDNLLWFFTDKSILDDSIFSERFKGGLVSTKIEKVVELQSFLDINSRIKIKKHIKSGGNISISKETKVKWAIEVEYYSLADVNKDKVNNLYNDLELRLKKRKAEIMKERVIH